jgi:hypothetical protein
MRHLPEDGRVGEAKRNPPQRGGGGFTLRGNTHPTADQYYILIDQYDITIDKNYT